VTGVIREQVLLALVKQQGREPDLLLWIENAYFSAKQKAGTTKESTSVLPHVQGKVREC